MNLILELQNNNEEMNGTKREGKRHNYSCGL